ncbi:MAG: universal stress protein [Alphaproteobacteria bacterium]|nr:universal stress protein [Alphaproteobacteria bacterium]
MSDSPSPDIEASNDKPATERSAVFLVVVDNSPEMRVALRWASLRARRTGGRVGLVRVIREADFQHWAAVGNLMQFEAREEAEQLLQEHASEVMRLYGGMPVLYLREGETKSAVVDLIQEEKDIRILVLAASTGRRGPGPLITHLTKKVIGQLRIPVTIVPGGLTDDQIDTLV